MATKKGEVKRLDPNGMKLDLLDMQIAALKQKCSKCGKRGETKKNLCTPGCYEEYQKERMQKLVGSDYKDKGTGYWRTYTLTENGDVKVSYKHRVIMEEAFRPLQDGEKVLFRDKNKDNLSLENLILVDKNGIPVFATCPHCNQPIAF